MPLLFEVGLVVEFLRLVSIFDELVIFGDDCLSPQFGSEMESSPVSGAPDIGHQPEFLDLLRLSEIKVEALDLFLETENDPGYLLSLFHWRYKEDS